jgi:DivIVA domain-containing protein
MAISVPRPDPTSPAAVAAASFSTTRRGFDPAEVRDLLRAVSAELARLIEREKFLERELEAVRQRSAMAPAQLDEDTVAALLGEETARIVQTAREAAAQIRARAEEAAARLLREATEEAARLRESAELDAARKRQDAAADAELELESAKQHGRDMVNEARQYREKVLADVARRRELARQQIEQLVHGRDRLLQAFERARLAAVDVVAELGSLGEEPAEFVNLSPTTGPVPLLVPGAAPPAAAEPTPEPEPAAEAVNDVEVELVDGESTLDDVAEAPSAEESAVETALVEPVADEPPAAEAPDVAARGEVAAEAELGRVVELRRPEPPVADGVEDLVDEDHDDDFDEVDDDSDVERAPAPVVALFAGEVDEPKPTVDDLFAKLRAASAEMVARGATESLASSGESPSGAGDASVETPFARRDEALVPLILAMGRKLKRALADEQNDVLDTLRRKEPVTTLEALVPDRQAHGERYRSAIDAEITDAAMAGAQSLSDGPLRELRASLDEPAVLAPVTEAIVTDIVEPLRERLGRCVEQAAGDNGSLSTLVRAVYREWKTQRIDEQVDDIARLAYGRGAFAVLDPGLRVCWLVDPDGPPCPDAEDNALGGVVPAGEPFPTGHTHPPAHSGCRCLLARADG